ncbi:MAG: hypothetical protein P8Y27_16555 [Chromatiaceae bacterium]|jgi:hypothetical protein
MRIGAGISSIQRLIAKFEDGTIDEVGYAHLCDLITRREAQLRTLTKHTDPQACRDEAAQRGCRGAPGADDRALQPAAARHR